MIILDTCSIIFLTLTPKKLSRLAKKTIDQAENIKRLYCCDISLWEIAMLIEKKRLDPKMETEEFLQLILQAHAMQVLSINSSIAALSVNYPGFSHFDPADRLIAATTIHYHASLVTIDKKLQKVPDLSVIW